MRSRNAPEATLNTPLATAEFDRAGHHLTVYVTGELNQDSVPPIAESIAARIEPDDLVVWLELADVTFCGSAGIAMLLALDSLTEQQGARLTLYNPPRHVRKLLNLMAVDHLRVWSEPVNNRTDSVVD